MEGVIQEILGVIVSNWDFGETCWHIFIGLALHLKSHECIQISGRCVKVKAGGGILITRF